MSDRALSCHRLLGAAALAVAFAASTFLSGPARAADKVSYYTWSGYELPEFHKPYMAEHPEGAAITVFGDDDEALAKVRAGFRPDIAHPCTDKLPEWKKAGLLQPIDPARIKNWDKIYPVFKQMSGVMEDGKVWMVPWDWGNTSILYRTDLVKNPEMSWKLLWDPQYKQKLATIDAVHDTWIVGALVAGVDPFTESKADIKKVSETLAQQRPLLRFYTNDMTSIEQGLASGELVAAMTWNSSYTSLRKQKVPVAFMNPKEKMLTWVCGMVVLKGAKDMDKVYDFINAQEDVASTKMLVSEYGYGTANSAAFESFTPAQLADLGLPADPETAIRNTILTVPMVNRPAIETAFERMKAGE
ncbi:extracellular solute-binding protein [Acidisoma cladoniae]|jgi:spermidine/putrescine transport system substrate-binding protein|uniref:extracellular solute-binding protein n=1 Tax=Acidisoma cladoniae TaxID=3040935 RepID=UPI0025509EA9|nr:extracellular solute-binding protein [Acidisoma sp. PAMC 29798]